MHFRRHEGSTGFSPHRKDCASHRTLYFSLTQRFYKMKGPQQPPRNYSSVRSEPGERGRLLFPGGEGRPESCWVVTDRTFNNTGLLLEREFTVSGSLIPLLSVSLNGHRAGFHPRSSSPGTSYPTPRLRSPSRQPMVQTPITFHGGRGIH